MIQLIAYCLCISLLTNRFLIAANKNLKKLVYNLNWSQLDWPCFLKLKYYIYLFDLVRYLIYLVSVVVIFLVELLSLNSNQNLLIIYVINSLLFLFNVMIEIYRIVQSHRVDETIRDIFSSDVKFSGKAVAMISEEQLDSMVCAQLSECLILDTQHRAFAHAKQLFKIQFQDVPYNKRGVNLMIGFHQTTIEAAKSILLTGFRSSKSGMLGPGIYFANNYDVTEHKRNQSTEGGAIFCAKIDMGKVYEMNDKNNEINYGRYFNSKYLHHAGGVVYDEFVVYNDSQILEYTLIVEMNAINNYRLQHKKPFCNCI